MTFSGISSVLIAPVTCREINLKIVKEIMPRQDVKNGFPEIQRFQHLALF